MAAKAPGHVEPVHKVLIVDDHPAVREGLALRISSQPDLEVCGEAGDVGEALALVASARPDLAVVDIALPSGDGIDLIKRLKARDGALRVLVWSMYSEESYAERALRAGALGYINKRQATQRIIDAIRRVLQGKVYLSEGTAETLLGRTVGRTGGVTLPVPQECLSNRELEVFRLLGEGLETAQVAARMHVSPKTVETYQARIKEKLRLESGKELIRLATTWLADNV
jgi:DNA-binding NarL/FixJ family response regulator